MINIQTFQNSFLIHWACRLLDENSEDWKIIPTETFKPLGGLEVFHSKIKFEKIKGIEMIKSSFWKSVLKAWLENNQFKEEIRQRDTVNNNKQITVNNTTLFIERALKNNLICIKDYMNNDHLISFEDYENKVGVYPTNLHDYLAIKTAISKVKNKLVEGEDNIYFFRKKDIRTLKRKDIFNMIRLEEKCFLRICWENR